MSQLVCLWKQPCRGLGSSRGNLPCFSYSLVFKQTENPGREGGRAGGEASRQMNSQPASPVGWSWGGGEGAPKRVRNAPALVMKHPLAMALGSPGPAWVVRDGRYGLGQLFIAGDVNDPGPTPGMGSWAGCKENTSSDLKIGLGEEWGMGRKGLGHCPGYLRDHCSPVAQRAMWHCPQPSPARGGGSISLPSH